MVKDLKATQEVRKYEYRCIDNSILTPVFKKIVVFPLVTFIPKKIPANLITIGANLFVFAGLYIALHKSQMGKWSQVLISLCLLFYLIGDHLDGAHAKRTDSSSALGEFCDHYLDAFNTGLILITLLLALNVTAWWIWMVLIGSSYYAHSSIIYEQFKTKTLNFDPLGSFEGVVLISMLISASCFQSVYEVMSLKFNGLRLIEYLVILTSACSIVTSISVVLRTDNTHFNFFIFITAILLIGITLFTNGLLGIIILILYCVLYIGKIMFGHLVNGKEPLPDIILPLALIFSSSYQSFFYLAIGYLVVQILLLLRNFFMSLGHEWTWVNTN